MNKMNHFKNSIQENSKMITHKFLKGDEFNPIFDDEAVNYSMKAILVIIAALVIPYVNIRYLVIFNNLFFKIIFVALIGLVAFRDPVTSLLLAIIFILAIQRLHNEKITNTVINPTQPSQPSQENESVNIPEVNFNAATNELNNQDHDQVSVEQNGAHSNMYQTAENQPSFNTRFTTNSQFIDAQSNIIPNSSYMSQVKTFESQFGAQGLEDGVQGYDFNYTNNLVEKSSMFSI